MKKYTTLFIDLDNTIFDFSASEKKAVKDALSENGMPSDDKTAEIYSLINKDYWERYERGEIKKEEIFVNRFLTLFEKTGKRCDANKLSNDYFIELSKRHDMIEYAYEILIYLKKKGYFLCAATNGISLTQHRRLREADIEKLFDVICVSEDAGHQKPEKEYFDFLVSKCNKTDRSEILIIGDSQSSDVLGGINSGIDVCFFNPKKEKCRYPVNFEISKLKELENIL